MSAKLTINSKVLALGLAGLSLSTDHDVLAFETPAYQVLAAQDDVEFRRYEAFIVAETLVTEVDDYKAAANQGFRRLFAYISGDNLSTQKIEMTAPVRQSPVSSKINMTSPVQQTQTEEGWKISFLLPAKYNMASAPVPTDSRILIREEPAQLMAALQYSGRWTERNLQKHQEALSSSLAEMDVMHRDNIVSAVYNSPFSLPFLRRNEVLVPVEELPSLKTISEE